MLLKDQKALQGVDSSEHSVLGTRWSLPCEHAWSDVSFKAMKELMEEIAASRSVH